MEKRDESNNLYQFLQSATFNSVRVDLIKVVSTIEEIMQERVVEGVITTMLASSCFVSYDGKTEQLPANLYSKVKHLKAEDKINIVIQANKIIDIKE